MYAPPSMDESTEIRPASLAAIALVFLKLGTIAFGGPAAHLAMMEEEFVRRRRWITHAEFLDRLATANLIPGPSSTEVAIFVGQLKCGWRGLIVAGACFIIPAALIVSAIAWAYGALRIIAQGRGHAVDDQARRRRHRGSGARQVGTNRPADGSPRDRRGTGGGAEHHWIEPGSRAASRWRSCGFSLGHEESALERERGRFSQVAGLPKVLAAAMAVTAAAAAFPSA